MKYDVRSSVRLFARGDFVTLRTRTRPDERLIRTERLGINLHLVGNHKRGIKPYAELTDNVDVLFLFRVRVFVFEIERTALRYRTEVFLEFFIRHTDTVIGYRERTRVLIRFDFNKEVLAGKPRKTFFQPFII